MVLWKSEQFEPLAPGADWSSATKTKCPRGSLPMADGPSPAGNGEPGSGVRVPVAGLILNPEMLPPTCCSEPLLATNTKDCTAAGAELPDPEPLPEDPLPADDPLPVDPPVLPVEPELPDEPPGAELPVLLPGGGVEAMVGGLLIVDVELFELAPHEQMRAHRSDVLMVRAARCMGSPRNPKKVVV
jgi:hypothetical protein